MLGAEHLFNHDAIPYRFAVIYRAECEKYYIKIRRIFSQGSWAQFILGI